MDTEYYSKKLNQLFERTDFDESALDYSNLDKHIAFIKQLAIVENSSMSIFDIFQKRYVFSQSRLLSLFGIDSDQMLKLNPQYFYKIIHPEDVPFLIETHYRFTDFVINLGMEEKKDYKLIYVFRMKDLEKKYRWFINQLLPLELDNKGNPWLMLVTYDMLPEGSSIQKAERKIVNMKTNEIHYFADDSREDKKNNLTKREIEILGLLAKGMASKKIADELFLSVNTVNNHRRNILEKTKSENTAMAIKYGQSLGIVE
jgi:DNA-binding CsgD family transcriptional regulator